MQYNLACCVLRIMLAANGYLRDCAQNGRMPEANKPALNLPVMVRRRDVSSGNSDCGLAVRLWCSCNGGAVR